ncbi:four-jointed box protein 1-like [Mya arenaria]|uniref:four-jointed box protein 1-like n=1 Tax=Mya arenaria TaxID=6604 RepID=UPI0022E0024B|nr:four-jointed box protein 1-like [Mya arenaria]XP_052810485.1 four-jointed box protein 1-like [Mya arenaria]XP_052810486.1 four-jointed box protein 1-like [Mya arenaria]XP_052810487.1 four-jointed box protein 1-like [Mya arenaria]XP_052810488.1 four-jointed box protein 1-like [Mya arenaria]
MRLRTGLIMAGIGFTIGVLCGLLVHLPAETLPAANFESQHLNRVRRTAGVENAADYGNPDNLISDKQGTVGKHSAQVDFMNNNYETLPVANRDKHGYKVITSDKPPNVSVLSKYPLSSDESVVYLSPDQHKLVLDNSVNNVSNASQPKRDTNADTPSDNSVNSNHNDGSQFLNRETQPLTRGETKALGHGKKTGNKIEIDNYQEESHSSGYDVTSGVFWSDTVEQSCPKGFNNEDTRGWKTKAANEKILAMNDGCGRMQNRVLTFESMDKACARYRLNVDQMQGEMFSYYLSKMLGINNVPPSVLHLADANSDQWSTIGQDIANAKWSEEKPVILSKWIDDLSPSYIPQEFRNLSSVLFPKDLKENAHSLDDKLVNGVTRTSLCELLQWSDLIIFDYLTANLDRVVNNLFNLQWNAKMMEKPAHNLEKDSSGRLVFIDNESGLFHGYRLLDKYAVYHESLLNSLCVFRKQTIDSIKRLVDRDNVNEALHSLFENSEPLYRSLPRIPVKNIKILTSRMQAILKHVQKCESQSV